MKMISKIISGLIHKKMKIKFLKYKKLKEDLDKFLHLKILL